jgi:hypothetical protein
MRLNIPAGEEIFLRFDVNDIRSSKIQKIEEDDSFLIEQTSPPIETIHLNKIVLLTYKNGSEKKDRLGFEARILSIAAGIGITLYKLNDPAPCDLRVWPRIRLDILPSVQAYCHGKEIQVIDISGGGAHVILQEGDCTPPDQGAIVNMKFVFEKGEVEMEGKILRKWQDASLQNHVAIQFQGSYNIKQFIY